jgi:hypothetical protein
MNEIGAPTQKSSAANGNALETTGKENSSAVAPSWAMAAKEHLLTRDLGSEWETCVKAWFDLEGQLGYGAKACGKV